MEECILQWIWGLLYSNWVVTGAILGARQHQGAHLQRCAPAGGASIGRARQADPIHGCRCFSEKLGVLFRATLRCGREAAHKAALKRGYAHVLGHFSNGTATKHQVTGKQLSMHGCFPEWPCRGCLATLGIGHKAGSQSSQAIWLLQQAASWQLLGGVARHASWDGWAAL